jgi:hypothetical protein
MSVVVDMGASWYMYICKCGCMYVMYMTDIVVYISVCIHAYMTDAVGSGCLDVWSKLVYLCMFVCMVIYTYMMKAVRSVVVNMR